MRGHPRTEPLGVLQAETNPILAITLGIGLVLIVGLHLVAGFKESRLDVEIVLNETEFVEACTVAEIPEKRALIRTIFRASYLAVW